eukprot:TRINITY_DN44680_c0_g1_i3.p1 TRINITY_DN44680_c0_g1~~TRINITY_DN44680_c0_g1_i3.p1  ORF type:complete len:366 (-),score=35.64 TRINITY_DN44680_c0_g1_i3:75-1172(-)
MRGGVTSPDDAGAMKMLLKGSAKLAKSATNRRLYCSTVQARTVTASTMREGSRFCIVSDLDHTMVDHHSAPGYDSLLAFNWLWNSKFRHDSYLVFSTGRSLTSYQSLREEAPLLTPDLLICSVGTEIYAETGSGLELDPEWIAKLDEFWNRDQIVSIVAEHFPALKAQGDSEQRPHKVSYHLQDREEAADTYIQRLRDALDKGGLKVKVVYSGGIDVDVLPECASKGLALQFLQKRWQAAGVCPTIQVNGDSGNDAELFEAPDVYGCIVSNAMAELVKWADANPNPNVLRATQRCAAGIIETMHHFKLVPDDAALPEQARAHDALIKLAKFRTEWLNGSIPNSEDELEKGMSPSQICSSKGLLQQ